MKAFISITGVEFLYYVCPNCKTYLIGDQEKKSLSHDSHVRNFWGNLDLSKPSDCIYSGKVFEYPTVELKEIK